MARSFPGSQVSFEPIARLLGESAPGLADADRDRRRRRPRVRLGPRVRPHASPALARSATLTAAHNSLTRARASRRSVLAAALPPPMSEGRNEHTGRGGRACLHHVRRRRHAAHTSAPAVHRRHRAGRRAGPPIRASARAWSRSRAGTRPPRSWSTRTSRCCSATSNACSTVSARPTSPYDHDDLAAGAPDAPEERPNGSSHCRACCWAAARRSTCRAAPCSSGAGSGCCCSSWTGRAAGRCRSSCWAAGPAREGLRPRRAGAARGRARPWASSAELMLRSLPFGLNATLVVAGLTVGAPRGPARRGRELRTLGGRPGRAHAGRLSSAGATRPSSRRSTRWEWPPRSPCSRAATARGALLSRYAFRVARTAVFVVPGPLPALTEVPWSDVRSPLSWRVLLGLLRGLLLAAPAVVRLRGAPVAARTPCSRRGCRDLVERGPAGADRPRGGRRRAQLDRRGPPVGRVPHAPGHPAPATAGLAHGWAASRSGRCSACSTCCSPASSGSSSATCSAARPGWRALPGSRTRSTRAAASSSWSPSPRSRCRCCWPRTGCSAPRARAVRRVVLGLAGGPGRAAAGDAGLGAGAHARLPARSTARPSCASTRPRSCSGWACCSCPSC